MNLTPREKDKLLVAMAAGVFCLCIRDRFDSLGPPGLSSQR